MSAFGAKRTSDEADARSSPTRMTQSGHRPEWNLAAQQSLPELRWRGRHALGKAFSGVAPSERAIFAARRSVTRERYCVLSPARILDRL